MNNQTAAALLEQGLVALDKIALHKPLFDFLILLHKWNKTYNLTAVRSLESMVSKHLLDSLRIAPWIKGNRILDVGSGAGFPGIPLALAFPHLEWVLLDANGKKARFLHEAKRVLQLNNVEIVEQRVEDYAAYKAFDTIVSRAFSDLCQFLQWTQHLLNDKGIWLAMKGAYPTEELSSIKHSYRVIPYEVEGLDASRCVVLIDNSTKE